MTNVPLAPVLVQLLEGHGVEAVVREDAVYLPRLDRWANLWMHPTSERMHLLEVVATVDDEVTVTDRCAGIGDTVESAKADGVQAFCSGTFHVLLAALWGVLERDQVDHEILFVEHREWDVYMGPCTTRISAGVQALVLPQALPDLVLQQWKRTLVDRRVHTARLYLAVVNGAVTVEAMIDDQPDAAMAEVFGGADWALPAAGFASLRWYLAACPRTDGPTHAVERASCSG